MAIDISTLDVDPGPAHEKTMMRRIIGIAKQFYQDPNNRQAYEAWRKTKDMEEVTHGTSHNHD